MAMLLGKKVGMTQVYDESGNLVPVTVIQAGPCDVMQVKTTETDGYNAVQLGFDEVKPLRRKKPQIGHAEKANTTPKKFIKEMRLLDETEQQYEAGGSVTVSAFSQDKSVDVIGTSKGKGFAGVMKRLNSEFRQRCRPRPRSQKGQENGWSHGQLPGYDEKP